MGPVPMMCGIWPLRIAIAAVAYLRATIVNQLVPGC